MLIKDLKFKSKEDKRRFQLRCSKYPKLFAQVTNNPTKAVFVFEKDQEEDFEITCPVENVERAKIEYENAAKVLGRELSFYIKSNYTYEPIEDVTVEQLKEAIWQDTVGWMLENEEG